VHHCCGIEPYLSYCFLRAETGLLLATGSALTTLTGTALPSSASALFQAAAPMYDSSKVGNDLQPIRNIECAWTEKLKDRA
jgi:hypothetical protein